jgi:hypothetical protein
MTSPTELLVQDAFELLWKAHLSFTRSARTYAPNRKALCRSFGGRYLHEVTPFDFRQHRKQRLEGLWPHHRRGVSLGTVFHDHGLFHLLYAKLREWKREGQKPCGFDLSRLRLPDFFPTDGVRKVRPPKTLVEWTPQEFRFVYRHATKRLRRVMVGLVDLDIRQGDLKRLKPDDYNPYDDHLHWVQSKTGKPWSLPVTRRVRRHIIEAKKNGREFIYDTTNIVKEFREARSDADVRKVLTLRALRKTAWNWVKRKTGDAGIASLLAGHASTRTGLDHYEIPTNEGLREAVNYLEKVFSTELRRRNGREKEVDTTRRFQAQSHP